MKGSSTIHLHAPKAQIQIFQNNQEGHPPKEAEGKLFTGLLLRNMSFLPLFHQAVVDVNVMPQLPSLLTTLAHLQVRNSTETHDFHELIPSEFESDQLGASEFGSYSCRVSSSTSDTIIDKKKEGSTNKVHDRFDMISELELPPILTKPRKLDDHSKAIESTKFRKSTSSKLKETKGHQSLSVKIVKVETSSSRIQKDQKIAAPYVRNSSAYPTGIRLRGNSPRLARKKLQQPFGSRKSVSKNRGGISDSFAVVKSSLDPQRDFKYSMREMIMENNIKESKDLEDLLACYLSLNSREYHDLIVKAFEQIWFDMARIKI
ncbi:hypothetical protein ACLB2K_027248 [Fragaria x ananassa]